MELPAQSDEGTSRPLAAPRPLPAAINWARFYGIVTGLLLAVMLFLIVRYPLRINDDSALYLHIGARILNGERPYVDYVEINLPTIHYLSAIPVFIGNLLSINAITVFMLGMWALMVWSVVMSVYILRRDRTPLPAFLVWSIPMAVAAISLIIMWLPLTGKPAFGEREHIYVLLIIPYVLLRWLRSRGSTIPTWSAFLLGFMAALAVGLKPYFVIVVAGAELYWLWQQRRPRYLFLQPEVLGAMLFAGLFAAYWLFNPAVGRAYFLDQLPAIAAGYSAYGFAPFGDLFWGQALLLVVPLAAFFALTRGGERGSGLVGLFGVITFGAILMFAVQMKGWYYQNVPALFFGSILLSMAFYVALVRRSRMHAFGAKVRRLPDQQLAIGVAIGAAVLVLVAILTPYATILDSGVYAVLMRYSRPGAPVMLLDSGVTSVYPILEQANRIQASRYLVAHPIPFAFYNRDTSTAYDPDYPLPALAQKYLDDVATDVKTRAPELILVSFRRCTGCPPNINLYDLLRSRGVIANVFAPEYNELGRVSRFVVYGRKSGLNP